MECYLCGSRHFSERKGKVRDSADLKILECQSCGLVQLSSSEHITRGHYESSGMHKIEDLPPSQQIINACLVDDTRRYKQLLPLIINKRVLDFGCGYTGFLSLVNQVAVYAHGVEPELRVRKLFSQDFTIFADINEITQQYDVITSFHVVEHLKDPIYIINKLCKHLAPGGTLIIEVPSSADALLSLYNCSAFQDFTYWSQHLYLFNPQTLSLLFKDTPLSIQAISQFQRYPLSNHLYWLSHAKPGGHKQWSYLDSDLLTEAYSQALAKIGACDTIIAYLKFPS